MAAVGLTAIRGSVALGLDAPIIEERLVHDVHTSP